MSKPVFQSVDAYLEAQPEPARGALDRVRAAIRRAVPDAEESISYNMPTYKLGGERLIYFAAWKAHVSLYAATAGVVAALGDALKPYPIEKGTIRFSLDQPIPVKLIEQIARFRATERSGRKPATRRKAAPHQL
jgi:uncharacterized protein YdhG (YjbR/CyaY superfamily)